MGHRREDLTDKPVRFFPVYSFLIIYHPATTPLEIVRVLGGAQDIAAMLERDRWPFRVGNGTRVR